MREDGVDRLTTRLRDELRIPTVLVSHAIAEVARLATDVVRLDGGKVLAAGAAANVLSSIGSAPTAGESPFAFVELTVTAIEEDGLGVMTSSAGTWHLPGHGLKVGQRVRAKIDASDVIIATAPPENISALNQHLSDVLGRYERFYKTGKRPRVPRKTAGGSFFSMMGASTSALQNK